MTNNYKYPSCYELREILGTIANRPFLNEFAQSRGVLITHVDRKNLAYELSNLFYDEADLELIRKAAYKIANNHNLSGFTVTSSNEKFDLKTAYESVRTNGRFPVGIKLDALQKLGSDNKFDYKGALEYTYAKPGRIEFIQNETLSFDFFMKHLGGSSWQVEIDCARSNDARELRDLFERHVLSTSENMDLINQDDLIDQKTIVFFDELANGGLDSKIWRFLDVKDLTVRRGKDEDEQEQDEDEDENSEEPKKPTKAELTGITQAILKGKNLRDDPFVKSCESNGYRFTMMTYEFEQIKGPSVITIKAEFKGRPKVFEVGISAVQAKTGKGTVLVQSSLSANENWLMRSTFWNNAKVIFRKVISTPISKPTTAAPSVDPKKPDKG